MTKYVWMKNKKTGVVKKVESILVSDYMAIGDWEKTQAPEPKEEAKKTKTSSK